MSEVKFYINEIKEIQKELNRISEKSKSLRQRKKIMESKVQDYLTKRNMTSIKCGNSVVKIDNVNHRQRKIKKEKEKDIKHTLQEAGIYNNGLVNKIIQQTSGRLERKNKIKIT
jgi:hypothetical protein